MSLSSASLIAELERLVSETQVRQVRRRALKDGVRRLKMEISDLMVCVCQVELSSVRSIGMGISACQ